MDRLVSTGSESITDPLSATRPQRTPEQESATLRPEVAFFAALAILCGVIAFIGAVPTKIYGHDIFIYLGNGWRIINGQRPHVDFTTPWGPVGFLISALGMTISRHSADGVGYGSALLALIVGAWCFLLGQNRLVFLPRAVVSLFLATLVSAPYSIGVSPFASSHAMIYNRYCYGLLGLILVECFTAHGGKSGGREAGWFDGISTGSLLSLELFMKASYFFMGIALTGAIALLLRSFPRRRILGMVLGFSLVSLCILAYLHFDVAAVVRDLQMAAGARAETLRSPVRVTRRHLPVLFEIVAFALAAVFMLRNRASEWKGLELPLLGGFLFLADIGIISGNAQTGGFPVCAVFAILALNEILKAPQETSVVESLSSRFVYAAAVGFGLLLLLPQFGSDLAGIAYGAWQKARPSIPETLLRFTSPDLKPVLLYESDDNPPSEGRMFTSYVNEGVALLERETRPDEKVLTMDVTNPFPYAMERRPPRGGHAAPTYHYNMTDRYRPSDDWYFGDADIVMLPKRPSQGDNHYTDFFRAYGPGLNQRFHLAAETDRWWMYRRKR